jgi:hypothetical protein
MDRKSFLSIFFIPELKSFGKKVGLFAGIVTVMFLALWSMGFSTGSSDLLAKRMDSPFIRFLSITIPSYKAEQSFFDKINAEFGSNEIKEKYQLNSHYFVPIGYLNFVTTRDRVVRARARLIDPDRSLYSYLFRDQKSSLLLTQDKLVRLEDAPWSCIVSSEFLSELGYDDADSYPTEVMYVETHDGTSVSTLPIAIAGVSINLPDKADILFSPKAFYNITNKYQVSAFRSSFQEYAYSIKGFVATKGLKSDVDAFLNKSSVGGNWQVEKNIDRHQIGFDIRASFSSENGKNQAQKALDDLFSQSSDYSLTYSLPYEDVFIGELGETKDDFLVVEMANLDSISSFSEYMAEEYELEVDLNDIESARNFSVFSNISTILSSVLTLFSIIIIVYIISKTIIDHIDRNAASLGTLKAFGLSNGNINAVYSGIALLTILSVFALSFLLAYILGPSMCILFFGEELVQGVASTDLFSLQLEWKYPLLFVLLPLVVIARLIHGKIKGRTPGDLIYGR